MLTKSGQKLEPTKIKTPFMMILGGKDKIISNKAAEEFYNQVEIGDKALIKYDDLDHLIVQD